MGEAEVQRTPGLQAKKLAVMKEVPGVPRDGRNVRQDYTYATAAGVFAAVRMAMIAHGLTISVSCAAVQTTEKQSKEGSLIYNRMVRLVVTLSDAETGESEVSELWGEGQDTGDKATNKAYTTGLKYWALMTFLLPQGYDEAERDEGTDRDPGRAPRAPGGGGKARQQSAAVPETAPAGPEQTAPASGKRATDALWDKVKAALTPMVQDLYRSAGLTKKGEVLAHYQEHGGRMEEIEGDLATRCYINAAAGEFQGKGDKPRLVARFKQSGAGAAVYLLPGGEWECECGAFEEKRTCEHVKVLQAAAGK